MIKKSILPILLFTFLFFMLVGCGTTDSFNVDDVVITAEDQYSIPAGTYTLQYTIESLSDLVKSYGAVVVIDVKDKAGETIVLSGDTFTVEYDEDYTVTISVTIDGETQSKVIHVVSLHSIDVYFTVSFELNGGTGTFIDQQVAYGAVPNLPESEPTKSGYTFTGWYYDQELQLFCDFGSAIYQNTILYAGFTENPTVTVTFDLNGGLGSINPIVTAPGSFITEPVAPTLEGAIFMGWFTDSSFDTPFLFEATNIYQTMTLYAKWEMLSNTFYTITYDLNGAVQLEPISEEVRESETIQQAPLDIVRTDYLLEGFSLTPDGLVLFDLDQPIESDLTLYAIWVKDFTYITDPVAFVEMSLVDDSTLDDDTQVVAQFISNGGIDVHDFLNRHSIDQNVISYGYLYGIDAELSYYSREAFKVEEVPYSESINWIDMRLTASNLLSDSQYSIRFFVQFEDTVLYSNVYSYQTPIVVDEGAAVGLDYVISGSRIRLSDPQWANRLYFFYEVLDGYTAVDNLNAYTSFSAIYHQGIHSVITTDDTTGLRYLHVYHLDIDHATITTTYSNASLFYGSGADLVFDVGMRFEESYNYNIVDAGILYSRNTFLLLKGIPTVNDKDADFHSNDRTITSSSRLDFYDHDTYYVRSYVLEDGLISYSSTIYAMVYDTVTNTYFMESSFQVSTTAVTGDYSYFIGSSIVPLHSYTLDTLNKTTISGSGSYTDRGFYYELYENSHLIQAVEMVSFNPIVGVIEGGVYTDSVLVSNDAINPYWYYTTDNGTTFHYLSTINRLSVKGYYTIYYRDASGMSSVNFQII